MSDKKHYELLVKRYLNGSATREEVKVFLHLLEKGALDCYLDKFDLEPVSGKTSGKLRRISKWQYVAAASILFLLATTLLLTFGRKRSPNEQVALAMKTPSAQPGTKRAVLTLSDGRIIELNNSKKWLSDKNTEIIEGNDALSYNATQEATQAVFNTVTTPRASEYQVTLPDGTRVWLNAESSIHYPTAFTAKERRVTLTGEAYFEVAKDKSKPFIVEAGGVETQVLGTHFNIKAYADEERMKTTLAEGSVRLTKHGVQQLLKPGQGGTVQKNSDYISVNDANIAEDLAWKDGYFQFDKTEFAGLMKQISRWYDIDIKYKDGHIPQARFVGRVSKYSNLSEVLQLFRLSGIKFSQISKTLVIEQ